jgi:hypothetical protein
MIELKEKRVLTAKHFDNGDGSFTFRGSTGLLHYFNKLGVGNSINDFREIDMTLVWDEAKQGWGFQFHSFNPFVPLYADGWMEFRDLYDNKDQTIRYKATCAHVAGRLIQSETIGMHPNETGVNMVIYDDAFGAGIDFLVYFNRHSMVKAVRLRESGRVIKDYAFEFQIDLPKGADTQFLPVFRAQSKESAIELDLKRPLAQGDTSYTLDTTAAKTFNTGKSIVVGNHKADGTEGFTYIRPFQAWDRSPFPQRWAVNVDYYLDANGNTFIRKNIPSSIVSSAVGDLLTDTDTGQLTPSADKSVVKDDGTTSWADSRDGTANATEATAGYVMCRHDSAATWYIYRYYINVDTSSITDGATINSATSALYTTTVDQSGGARSYDVYGSTASDAIATSDYNAYGSEYSTRKTAASLSTSAYNVWTWNATGLAAVSTTGKTKFVYKEAIYDGDNTAPGVAANPYIGNAVGGSANPPYLQVVYTASVANTGFFGLM